MNFIVSNCSRQTNVFSIWYHWWCKIDLIYIDETTIDQVDVVYDVH